MAKILVVDDDTAINELIKVNLELAGYDVCQAYDGVKGFALAKQELPSLIILDVIFIICICKSCTLINKFRICN